MKKLITTLVSCALLALFSTAANAGNWGKIRIGVEGAYPPFSWV